MSPVLVSAFGVDVSSYAVFVTLAYTVGLAWAASTMVRHGRAIVDVRDGAIVLVLGALFGGKVFHVLFEAEGHVLGDGTRARGVIDLVVDDPLHAFGFAEPGFVFYGGLVGASLVCVLFARARGIGRVREGFDDAAAPLALGLAIGRVGCFAAGCCYGAPDDGALAVRFPEGHPTFGQAVFPVQLVESAFALALVFAIVAFRRGRRAPGAAFALFVGCYGVFRFAIESLRADSERGLWFGGALSTSQIVGLASLMLVVALVVRARRGACDAVMRSSTVHAP